MRTGSTGTNTHTHTHTHSSVHKTSAGYQLSLLSAASAVALTNQQLESMHTDLVTEQWLLDTFDTPGIQRVLRL